MRNLPLTLTAGGRHYGFAGLVMALFGLTIVLVSPFRAWMVDRHGPAAPGVRLDWQWRAAAAPPDSYRLGRSSDSVPCTRAAPNNARGDRILSPVRAAAGSAAGGCRWGRERQRR